MRKRNEWKTYLPYIVVIVFLIIASFYDYAMDDALYQPDNIFGLFFERIILLPVEMILPIGFMCLYRVRHHGFYALCYVISCGFIVGDALQYWIALDTIRLPLFIMMVIFTIFLTLLLLRLPITFCKKYEKFFIFTLLVMLSSMLLTTLIKQLWGRVRYREMLDNVALFSPWFLPQGVNGFHSFPSGHTTMMASILCYLQIHRAKGIHRQCSPISYILITFLICGMMFSRMLVGAHFLSDVSVGFAITYTMYLFWRKRLFREDYK